MYVYLLGNTPFHFKLVPFINTTCMLAMGGNPTYLGTPKPSTSDFWSTFIRLAGTTVQHAIMSG
jgi:hypothetical protein